MSIRVLIVDDHAVVRSGLRLLLEAEDGVEPVGEAGTAQDAVFQARALTPDVILLDVLLPDRTGLEILPSSSTRTLMPKCSSSRCRTSHATCARRSRRAPAATSSRRPPTPRSWPRFARSRAAAATSTPSSAPG